MILLGWQKREKSYIKGQCYEKNQHSIHEFVCCISKS